MIVYTAVAGGYDQIKPHPEHRGVDWWFCYTDDPDADVANWDRVVYEPVHEHPRLAAKWWKYAPPGHGPSLWVDASLSFTAEWIDQAIAGLATSDWFLFPHPDRTSLIDEAIASAGLRKYDGQDLVAQAQHYIDQGWPDDRLWAATTIGRNHTPDTYAIGAAVYEDCVRWTHQDQLALPVALDRYGVKPATPPDHTLWDNPWFTIHAHTRPDE